VRFEIKDEWNEKISSAQSVLLSVRIVSTFYVLNKTLSLLHIKLSRIACSMTTLLSTLLSTHQNYFYITHYKYYFKILSVFLMY